MSRNIAIILAVFVVLLAAWFVLMGGDPEAGPPDTAPVDTTTTTGN
jgi:hypothetical protein